MSNAMKSKSSFDRFGGSVTASGDKVQELKEVLEGKNVADATIPESSEEVPLLKAQLAEVEEKFKKIEAEALADKEKYVRTLAEFENFRKRMEKEKEEAIRFGNDRLLKEFLPVLDHLEMTVDHAIKDLDPQSKKDPLIEGVEMVLKQFVGLLEKSGFKIISGEGLPFNPHHQEAIAQVESPEKEGTVVQVHRKGFMLHDRVVRPALVSIAKESQNGENGKSQTKDMLH